MNAKKVFETERLMLQELTSDDASFLLALLNTPSWLKFIGDRNVHSIEDALGQIENNYQRSYRENNFGLWRIHLKENGQPVGMCGLVKRDFLDDIDIGFAFLPEHEGKGYGFESARATLEYAKDTLRIEKIVAITDADNAASIGLIKKLGMRLEKRIGLEDGNSALLFSPEG